MTKYEVVILDRAKRPFRVLNARYEGRIYEKLFSLATDSEKGKQIAKRLIPRHYLQEYGVTNLWKLNLPDAWRALYTITKTKDDAEILILDILSHKDYERMLKY